MPIYLTLQLIRCAATMSPWPPVSSYLTFSPLPPREVAVIFCHIISTVTDSFPLRNMMLYVARTFLTPHLSVSDKPPYYRSAKLLLIIRLPQISQPYFFVFVSNMCASFYFMAYIYVSITRIVLKGHDTRVHFRQLIFFDVGALLLQILFKRARFSIKIV